MTSTLTFKVLLTLSKIKKIYLSVWPRTSNNWNLKETCSIGSEIIATRTTGKVPYYNPWWHIQGELTIANIMNILEMFNHGAKRSEIWDSGLTYTTYMRCLRPFSVQDHFGVIRCTCLNMAQRMAVEWNGVKSGTRGYLLHVQEVPLTF